MVCKGTQQLPSISVDNTLHIYVPDIELDLQLPEELKQYSNRCLWFISLIYSHLIYNQRTKNGEVCLKAAYFRDQLGRRIYTKLISHLEAIGLINVKRSWSEGHYSMAYSLGKTIRTVKFHKIIIIDPHLAHHSNHWRQQNDRTAYCPIRTTLRDIMQPRITVDYQAALDTIRSLDWTDKPDGYYQSTEALDHLNNKEYRFTTDQYGRCHHSITAQKREVRQHLQADNQPLYELDISNSQPLILGLTCLNWINNDKSLHKIKDWRSYNRKDWQRGGIEPPADKSQPCHIYQKVLERSITFGAPHMPPDLRRYLDLCQNGTFYEHMAQCSDIDISEEESREAFKQQCFQNIFYYKRKSRSKLLSIFTDQFPTIAEFIEHVRRNDKMHLACWMQQVESSIIIERCIGRFIKEYPNAFIFLVHDSFIVHEEYLNVILQIILQEFKKHNIQPTLKQKERRNTGVEKERCDEGGLCTRDTGEVRYRNIRGEFSLTVSQTNEHSLVTIEKILRQQVKTAADGRCTCCGKAKTIITQYMAHPDQKVIDVKNNNVIRIKAICRSCQRYYRIIMRDLGHWPDAKDISHSTMDDIPPSIKHKLAQMSSYLNNRIEHNQPQQGELDMKPYQFRKDHTPLFDRMSKQELSSYIDTMMAPPVDAEPVRDEIKMSEYEAKQRGIDLNWVMEDYGDDLVTAAYIMNACINDD